MITVNTLIIARNDFGDDIYCIYIIIVPSIDRTLVEYSELYVHMDTLSLHQTYFPLHAFKLRFHSKLP